MLILLWTWLRLLLFLFFLCSYQIRELHSNLLYRPLTLFSDLVQVCDQSFIDRFCRSDFESLINSKFLEHSEL